MKSLLVLVAIGVVLCALGGFILGGSLRPRRVTA